MGKYYLPGIGGQVDDVDGTPYQSSPLLNTYSPRLFGSPPQLTHSNDMRLMSANPNMKNTPGPVGDFYLTKVLQNAQIANFFVGRAMFTGGHGTIADCIRVAAQYAVALSKYDIYGKESAPLESKSAGQAAMKEHNLDTYKQKMNEEASSDNKLILDEDGDYVSDLTGADSIFTSIGEFFGEAGSGIVSSFLTTMSANQPFYTFESDWASYINNVKMMINSAVIMLGLQNACVRIGDTFWPIGVAGSTNSVSESDYDIWSNYRFITPSQNLGDVTGVDALTGDTTQYVSFMCEPLSASESYENSIGESQIYSSVLKMGDTFGTEVAFLTNASSSKIDDGLLNMIRGSTDLASSVLSNLGGGVGRFTAALAGGMVKSFLGDHVIYPQVFQGHTSTSGQDISIKLVASSGDPYAYLTEILVPLFFILGMVLPQGSNKNAAAYAHPPLIQCNIPGLWGTRLGMVRSVSVTKNPDINDVSIHGYPLAINVNVSIADLQHVLMTSPMDSPATFLNNHTMFDYIAQCAGVDKYRTNGSIRLVTKLALAANANGNVFHNIGDAFLNDWTSLANKLSGAIRI